MIDGDDREERGDEGETSSIKPSGDGQGEAEREEQSGEGAQEAPAAETTPDAGRPDEEQTAAAATDQAEEQPAMALEGGSDEGGTVEDEDVSGAMAGGSAAAETPSEPENMPDNAAIDEETVEYSEEEDSVIDNDELGLVSDDDALPWLESSDYDEVESVDAWRITGFVVLGLVALSLLVGGIWYFSNRGEDGVPVADGSTIEAPDTPYKERPEDPGGKTFEGTGDMAPAVGEGESREGRLAEGSATPEPIASSEPNEDPEEEPSTPSANDNRIAVQVGAYRDESTAEAGWKQIQRQTDALSNVEYRIVKGEADIGTVYRLQALPGDMAAARRLRDALQADGVASQIKQ